jgi:molybdopterin converting factor small subunit
MAAARCVRDLIALIEVEHPQIGELIHKKKVLVSVNHEIAHGDLEIKQGDEVALLPPFAGGNCYGADGRRIDAGAYPA